MKPNQQINLGPVRKIILHFDLYKTILLADPSGLKSKEEFVIINFLFINFFKIFIDY